MAGFDPDAYLASKPAAPASGFDPDAYLRQGASGIPGPRQEAGPLTKLGRAAASLADVTIGGVLPTITQQVGYPIARALGHSPEEAARTAGAVTSVVEKPFGKAFGVTGTPEYQQEASQRLMNFIGGNIQKGSSWIAQKTGLPESDVSNMIGNMLLAAPEAARAAKPIVAEAAQAASPFLTPARNALQAARKATVEGGRNVASELIGSVSGKPGEAYRQAYMAGKTGDTTFLENLRGKVPADELLGDIKQGIAKIQNDNSAAYATAKTGWAADTTPLNIDKVTAAYDKVKSTLEQRGKPLIGEAEQRIVNEIGDVLEQWKTDPTARTALDFDALKRRIDAIYPESPKHTQAQRAVTEVRNAVKDEITSNVQGYADAMKAYDQQLTLIRDINKALTGSDKIAKETAINKALGLLKKTPGAEFKRSMAEELAAQGGVDIAPAVAGQELGQWIPGSGVGRAIMGGGLTTATFLRHPEMLAVVPFTSPRLMGEAMYATGRMAGTGGRAANALTAMTPQQAAFANMLAVQAAANQQRR